MRVFITKYAMTHGVFELEVAPVIERVGGATMVSAKIVTGESGGWYLAHFHRPDWHLTESEACARFLEMQARTLANAQRKLNRLAAKTFAVKPAPWKVHTNEVLAMEPHTS